MNINGRPVGRGGNINGRAGSTAQSQYSPTFARASQLNAFSTNPRVTWASVGEQFQVGADLASTEQIFATRVKTRIAGGRWLALAPVFVCASQTAFKSPFGVTTQPKCTFSWSLELANGTLTPNTYQSPNTGGTVLNGTINGVVDGVMMGGQVIIGDLIYASAASLPYFQWTDSALLPWIRCAFSKKNAADQLFSVLNTEYNFPSNCYYATCTTYANAKTLITTSGTSGLNTTDNKWKTGSGQNLPSCIGFIGIPLDNQKSFVFFGTSIYDGDGSAPAMQGGVDPANNTIANYKLWGFPAIFGEALTNSVPVMNFGVGASSFANVWSGVSTDSDWFTTPQQIPLNRGIVEKLVKYFDICIGYDVNNDADATFAECINNFVGTVRAANPALKVYACRVPNGYVDVAGSTVAYSSALDVRWSLWDTAYSSGLIHGVLTVREGGNIYFNAGTQVTGTTTAVGTTTTVIDSTATWVPQQWINSFVSIGGVQRLITGNNRTTLTCVAYGAAPGSGTTYLIQGNTSGDGLHPNAFGQRRLAANFKTAISAVESIPYFTRTA